MLSCASCIEHATAGARLTRALIAASVLVAVTQAGPLQTPAAVTAAAAAGYVAQQQQQQDQQKQDQQSLQELHTVYRHFLENTLVKEFHRMSRSLPDIQCQAAALWPKYLSGAAAARQQATDDGVSELRSASVHLA